MTRAHVDVCSGVGGFSLAARWAGLTTVAHAEIEPYPSAVLARQFPDVPNLGDMRHVTRDALSRLGVDDIFLLTGGIPCQPASCAGRRKGSADARWLWPEFLRLVRGVRPLWLLAENPRGIVTLEPHGLDWICGELEAAGYEVWAAVVGAWAVGAPHKRDRVFIVGRDKDGCMASAMQPRSPSVARPRNHGGEGVSDGRADAVGSHGGGQGRSLRTDMWEIVHAAQWPTMTAEQAEHPGRSKSKPGQQVHLASAIKQRATPTTQDTKQNGSRPESRTFSQPLNSQAGGSLNPAWVDSLQGFPQGWTELPAGLLAPARPKNTGKPHALPKVSLTELHG